MVWNDANNQDGVRPESVTLKLVAKVGEKDVFQDAVFDDFGEWTKTVTSGDGTWTTVWENLPRFTSENQQITYSIVEVNAEGGEITQGNSLDDNYTVTAYNAFGDGYMTVTNTHTPVPVNITINKVWKDNNDQDGIRPDSVTGSLYQAEGGSYVKVQDFVINDTNRTTIEDLPKYVKGSLIQYYITENVVNGYTVAADVAAAENTYFAVGDDNKITLTNTHNPGTVEYTVTLTWDDNDNAAGKRPDTVTVNLGDKWSVTLTVGEGNTGITDVDTSELPEGASAVWDTETKILTVTKLPEFVGGKQQTYQGSVANIADYDETITAFGPNSVSYKLS